MRQARRSPLVALLTALSLFIAPVTPAVASTETTASTDVTIQAAPTTEASNAADPKEGNITREVSIDSPATVIKSESSSSNNIIVEEEGDDEEEAAANGENDQSPGLLESIGALATVVVSNPDLPGKLVTAVVRSLLPRIGIEGIGDNVNVLIAFPSENWNDNGEDPADRPSSITVEFLYNGEVAYTRTVSSSDEYRVGDWTAGSYSKMVTLPDQDGDDAAYEYEARISVADGVPYHGSAYVNGSNPIHWDSADPEDYENYPSDPAVYRALIGSMTRDEAPSGYENLPVFATWYDDGYDPSDRPASISGSIYCNSANDGKKVASFTLSSSDAISQDGWAAQWAKQIQVPYYNGGFSVYDYTIGLSSAVPSYSYEAHQNVQPTLVAADEYPGEYPYDIMGEEIALTHAEVPNGTTTIPVVINWYNPDSVTLPASVDITLVSPSGSYTATSTISASDTITENGVTRTWAKEVTIPNIPTGSQAPSSFWTNHWGAGPDTESISTSTVGYESGGATNQPFYNDETYNEGPDGIVMMIDCYDLTLPMDLNVQLKMPQLEDPSITPASFNVSVLRNGTVVDTHTISASDTIAPDPTMAEGQGVSQDAPYVYTFTNLPRATDRALANGSSGYSISVTPVEASDDSGIFIKGEDSYTELGFESDWGFETSFSSIKGFKVYIRYREHSYSQETLSVARGDSNITVDPSTGTGSDQVPSHVTVTISANGVGTGITDASGYYSVENHDEISPTYVDANTISYDLGNLTQGEGRNISYAVLDAYIDDDMTFPETVTITYSYPDGFTVTNETLGWAEYAQISEGWYDYVDHNEEIQPSGTSTTQTIDGSKITSVRFGFSCDYDNNGSSGNDPTPPGPVEPDHYTTESHLLWMAPDTPDLSTNPTASGISIGDREDYTDDVTIRATFTGLNSGQNGYTLAAVKSSNNLDTRQPTLVSTNTGVNEFEDVYTITLNRDDGYDLLNIGMATGYNMRVRLDILPIENGKGYYNNDTAGIMYHDLGYSVVGRPLAPNDGTPGWADTLAFVQAADTIYQTPSYYDRFAYGVVPQSGNDDPATVSAGAQIYFVGDEGHENERPRYIQVPLFRAYENDVQANKENASWSYVSANNVDLQNATVLPTGAYYTSFPDLPLESDHDDVYWYYKVKDVMANYNDGYYPIASNYPYVASYREGKDGLNVVTLTYTGGLTDPVVVDVTHNWDDSEDASHIRPESISYSLDVYDENDTYIGTVGSTQLTDDDEISEALEDEGVQTWTKKGVWAVERPTANRVYKLSATYGASAEPEGYTTTPIALTSTARGLSFEATSELDTNNNNDPNDPGNDPNGGGDTPVVNTEGTGTITINQLHNTGAVYDAYKVFEADVVTRTENNVDTDYATHLAWAGGQNGTVHTAVMGFLNSWDADDNGVSDYAEWLTARYGNTNGADIPQNAAEFIGERIGEEGGTNASPTASGTNTTPRTTQAGSFANELAQALATSGVNPSTVNTGQAFTSDQGYYLFVTHTDSINPTGEAGTAPIWAALSGTKAKTINEKTAIPSLAKTVKDDDEEGWGKIADANTGQDVTYRLEASLPTNLDAFETYSLVFRDNLPEHMDIANGDTSSVHVYLVNGNTRHEITSTATIEGNGSIEWKDAEDAENPRQLVVTLNNVRQNWGENITVDNGTHFVVEYDAHLTEGVEDENLGTDYNESVAQLTYTADPITYATDVTPTDYARLAAYTISLDKVDQATRQAIDGAEFIIQTTAGGSNVWLLADGSFTNSAGTAYHFTTTNGTFAVHGVDSGTYIISEVVSPTNYDPMDNDITLVITATKEQVTGSLTDLGATMSGGMTGQLDSNIPAAANKDGIVRLDTPSGEVGVRVSNQLVIRMPITGMTGRDSLVLTGGVLAVACLAIVAKRRMEDDEAYEWVIG